jgi:hypothetical protein
MNSSTEIQERIDGALAGEAAAIVRDWEQVEMIIPLDLAATASASGALVRRRGIRRATDLLRIILAYAMCDWALRLVGAWCVLIGLADVSDVAILNRLRKSSTWLGGRLSAYCNGVGST